MAKSPKESPGGVDPSAGPADGAADSAVESAAAVDRLGPDQADGALRAEQLTAVDEVNAALQAMTEQDHADELFDEVPQMRDFIGAYHAKIEKLARHFSRDPKMHARLTRMAHLFAEFRNGLKDV